MGRKRREKSVFMKYFAIFFFSVATAYVVRKFLKFQKMELSCAFLKKKKEKKMRNVQIFIARGLNSFFIYEWDVKCNQTFLDEGINVVM